MVITTYKCNYYSLYYTLLLREFADAVETLHDDHCCRRLLLLHCPNVINSGWIDAPFAEAQTQQGSVISRLWFALQRDLRTGTGQPGSSSSLKRPWIFKPVIHSAPQLLLTRISGDHHLHILAGPGLNPAVNRHNLQPHLCYCLNIRATHCPPFSVSEFRFSVLITAGEGFSTWPL